MEETGYAQEAVNKKRKTTNVFGDRPREDYASFDTTPPPSSGVVADQLFEEVEDSRKDSLYVNAFETCLNVVLENESHLFNEEELNVFSRYRLLPCKKSNEAANKDESRYLYVRLFMRKSDHWIRISRLGYYGDLSDVDKACLGLWSRDFPFASDNSSITDLQVALHLLNLDELKLLAKQYKCQGTTKRQLVTSLSASGSCQSSLIETGQMTLSFDERGKLTSRVGKLVEKIKGIVGPMIKLKMEHVTLFHRVHLVFYRSTEYNEKSLVPFVLAKMQKRTFPSYEVHRTTNIFASRVELLAYEEALKIEAGVDEMLQFMVPKQDDLRKVLDIFYQIWPKWQEAIILAQSSIENGEDTDLYLRHFHATYIWTRLVHRGAYVLSRFKHYEREHEILTALLSQHQYRVGKRGEWYTRKALIEQHYMAGDVKDPTLCRHWKQIALTTCIEGIRHPFTHVIYHHDLQKRIRRLEKDLRIPKRNAHDFSHVQLKKPTERMIHGTRLSEIVIGKKIIWRDLSGEDCSVEELCLSHYRKMGWKGFHCEGGLMRCLFSLLFWDILFAPVPNVFQTEFQSCPLDLWTDAFYPARSSDVNRRLAQISNGEGPDLIRKVDNEQRTKETVCIGLNWEYDATDLLESAQCMKGQALATVCRVLCEEYGQRCSGMPDLL